MIDTSGWTPGIDVYHGDGDIDWQQVLDAGCTFGCVKATTGVSTPDPKFPQNWQRQSECGITRIAYHWLIPTDDGDQQSDFFLKAVNPIGTDLAMLDVEDDGQGSVDSHTIRVCALAWCQQVQAAMGGRLPIVYTYPDFAQRHDLASALSPYPLMISDPSRFQQGQDPRTPPGWDWQFWQNVTTDVGGVIVPGCPGPVDHIYYRGSHDDLIANFGI